MFDKIIPIPNNPSSSASPSAKKIKKVFSYENIDREWLQLCQNNSLDNTVLDFDPYSFGIYRK